MRKKTVISIILTAAIVFSMNVSVFADALTDWQTAQAMVTALNQQIQTNTMQNPQFSATPEGKQLQAQFLAAQEKANALLPQAIAIAQGQTTQSGSASSVQTANVPAKGYIRLADGTTVTPGGRLSLAQLQSAVFVNNTGSTLYYAAIAAPNVYTVVGDDPDWAYEGQVAAQQTISLGNYLNMFNSNPTFNCLTMELTTSTAAMPSEYSFFVR